MEVVIHNQIASTKTVLRFRSTLPYDTEISESFALHDKESIDGFAFGAGDKRVVGKVFDRLPPDGVLGAWAANAVPVGLAERRGAEGHFRIFPMKPGEIKAVEIRTLRPLEMRQGTLEYAIPEQNLPLGKIPFELRVDVSDELPLHSLQTVGFQGTLRRLGPHHRRVIFQTQGGLPGGDLKIRYRVARGPNPLRLIAHRSGEGEGSFLLFLTPGEEAPYVTGRGRDLVFVVDVSERMSGRPLDRVKRGLISLLARLRRQDRFEVIALGERAKPLFGGLRHADERARRKASARILAFAHQRRSNLRIGLSQALYALQNVPASRPRAIVLISDGHGEAETRDLLASERARQVRIYAVGVGRSVKHAELERLARQSGGAAAFVSDNAEMVGEMLGFYDRMAIPLLREVSVRFAGIDAELVYPAPIPTIHHDGQLLLAGRYRAPAKGRVEVLARVGADVQRFSLDTEMPERASGTDYVEKVWASERVAHLVSTTWRDHSPDIDSEVRRLGTRYGLLTPYSMILAVPDDRLGPSGGKTELYDELRSLQARLPAGDPVLGIQAPGQARKVTAYFPSGAARELRYDPLRARWSIRPELPSGVPGGVHSIYAEIQHADGHSEWRHLAYEVNAGAPAFDVEVPAATQPGTFLPVHVDPLEPVTGVTAQVVGTPGTVDLRLDPQTGHYVGQIRLPVAPARLRIVIENLGRRRLERTVMVARPPA
jgi:Ca-activated chloride channel family protein